MLSNHFRIFFTTCALHWNCYVGKSTEESLDFDEEASLMNRLAKLLLSQPMCRWLNRPFVLALVPTQHLCRSVQRHKFTLSCWNPRCYLDKFYWVQRRDFASCWLCVAQAPPLYLQCPGWGAAAALSHGGLGGVQVPQVEKHIST